MCRSYLVLLRMGFTLPAWLPSRRCALTAPFQLFLVFFANKKSLGSFLSVALSLNESEDPKAGRYPASCLNGARTFLAYRNTRDRLTL